jgi:predicted lipoprotein with Yx(FWY)xxD motif
MRKGTWATIIIAILIVAGVVYAVVHKPAKTTTTSNTTTSSQSTKPKTTTTAQVIQTKTASGVGSYLADSNGNALYTYSADKQGVSNCSAACLYNWPIYDASNAPATLPANVTVITRSDGDKQYAYKGLPLYTFTSDSSGQVTGDGVENFHVAKP